MSALENGTPSPRPPSFPPPRRSTNSHPHTHAHTHTKKNMADPKGEETGKEENSGADAEPTTAAGMMAAMARHGDGTNVMKESIQTFSNVDGIDRKGDVMVPATDMGQARASIGSMLEEARAKADGKKKEKKKKKKKEKEEGEGKAGAGAGGEDMWDFGATPFSEFGRTLDDLLGAFLLWARTGGEEEDEEDDAAASAPDRQINVTKAFRRLESYAEWMQDNSEELTAEPLTAASVRDDLEPWKMSTSPDRRGRLVWWIDLGQMDVARVKEQSPAGVLRAFVWYAHYVLFDERAQTRGMVFMENCAEMGFIQSITLVPMSVGTKLDRLTMGVLPIKMKALYIFEVAMWMSLFMKMAGMFMSNKMKERILICDDYSGVEEIVALEHIPKGFGTLQGGMEKDEAETKYLGK